MQGNELIQLGLGNVQRIIDRVMEGLTPAEIKWQPRPDANSIGLLLFHIARSEDNFVQTLLQGKPQLWIGSQWCQKLGKEQTDTGSRYTAEQVAGFTCPDINFLRAYSSAVRQNTLDYLKTVTPENLDASVNLLPMGPPPSAVGGTPPAGRHLSLKLARC